MNINKNQFCSKIYLQNAICIEGIYPDKKFDNYFKGIVKYCFKIFYYKCGMSSVLNPNALTLFIQ